VGPLVSENRVLRLVRPGLAGTQDGRPRQLPGIAALKGSRPTIYGALAKVLYGRPN
jgi:hypothetical protein